jgi:tetratricopeptide (TPR) repeat protein
VGIEKLNAQYQKAYLLDDLGERLANLEFIIKAVQEYLRVYELAIPLEKMPDEVKALALKSLYKAGYLLYNWGDYKDHRKAAKYFEYIIANFPDSHEYPEALKYRALLAFKTAKSRKDKGEFAVALDYLLKFAEEFPESNYAPMALFRVAESYFAMGVWRSQKAWESVDPNIKSDELLLAGEAYSNAIMNYRKALQAYGVDNKTRMEMKNYIVETEKLIAINIYNIGAELVSLRLPVELRKTNANEAIGYFKEILNKYPHTDYADLSRVQLGLCYEYLEEWEKAEKWYDSLIEKYTDDDGEIIKPFSEDIIRALEFSIERKNQLLFYRRLISFSKNQSFNILSCQYIKVS